MSEWVSVKDRLPEWAKFVIITDGLWVGTCIYLGNFDGSDLDCEITHWMPLPEPPQPEALVGM